MAIKLSSRWRQPWTDYRGTRSIPKSDLPSTNRGRPQFAFLLAQRGPYLTKGPACILNLLASCVCPRWLVWFTATLGIIQTGPYVVWVALFACWRACPGVEPEIVRSCGPCASPFRHKPTPTIAYVSGIANPCDNILRITVTAHRGGSIDIKFASQPAPLEKMW